jgi:hypothetical protein
LLLAQTGGDVGTWGQKLNNDVFSILDNNLGGNLTLSVAGGINVTLTAAQAENLYYNFTGVLTGSIDVIWPTGAGFYVVNNATTGAFTLTAMPTGGAGVAIPQGETALVFISTNTGTAFIVGVLSTSPTFTGTVTIDGNLSVVQAGSSQAYFGSMGANSSVVTINNAAGGNQSLVVFQDAGTTKYKLGWTGSTFVLYDDAGSENFLTATTGGDLTLGPAQTTYLGQSGNVGIGTATLTYPLNVVSASATQAYFGSTGSNQAGIVINAPSGQSQAITLSENGSATWTVFVNASSSNNFNLQDSANNRNFITAASGGTMTLGYNQSTTINSSGVVSFGSHSIGANGYTRTTDGLIIQWGSVQSADSLTTNVTFPVTFPNNFFSLGASQSGWGGSSPDFINGWYISSQSTSGFSVVNRSNGTCNFNWIAIGN